jgi:CheY-like chemotaxis protein
VKLLVPGALSGQDGFFGLPSADLMIAPDRSLRILLVEDHVATASALAKTLLRLGFAVAPANSARTAMEVARLQTFDLLITDIGLPEKNGWELFRELRTLQPQLMGIAVTGYADPQALHRSTEVGLTVHLVKPATVQQVLSAIAQLFPGSAASAPSQPAGDARLQLLYLEDDPRDIELLQSTCARNDPDCAITAAMSQATFIAFLQSGRFDGILSDSGLPNLPGADAVGLARSLAPSLPYVFLCGRMDDGKRADLLAAKPDGMFSKDQPEDTARAIALLRRLRGNRGSATHGAPR